MARLRVLRVCRSICDITAMDNGDNGAQEPERRGNYAHSQRLTWLDATRITGVEVPKPDQIADALNATPRGGQRYAKSVWRVRRRPVSFHPKG